MYEDFDITYKAKADRHFHDAVEGRKKRNKIIQVVTATLSSEHIAMKHLQKHSISQTLHC